MTDEDLVQYATDFRNGILNGDSSEWMCFAVCAPLEGLLCFEGIQVKMVMIDLGHCNHYYLELPDGRVLDPTADQFNYMRAKPMPPVYLGPFIGIYG